MYIDTPDVRSQVSGEFCQFNILILSRIYCISSMHAEMDLTLYFSPVSYFQWSGIWPFDRKSSTYLRTWIAAGNLANYTNPSRVALLLQADTKHEYIPVLPSSEEARAEYGRISSTVTMEN